MLSRRQPVDVQRIVEDVFARSVCIYYCKYILTHISTSEICSVSRRWLISPDYIQFISSLGVLSMNLFIINLITFGTWKRRTYFSCLISLISFADTYTTSHQIKRIWYFLCLLRSVVFCTNVTIFIIFFSLMKYTYKQSFLITQFLSLQTKIRNKFSYRKQESLQDTPVVEFHTNRKWVSHDTHTI